MTPSDTNTLALDRRSQLGRWHAAHGAAFVERSGASFVADYGDPDAEADAAARAALIDLSLLHRDGITGANSTAALQTAGFQTPDRPNMAATQANGDILLRLSIQEYLLLSLSLLRPDGNSSARNTRTLPAGKRIYSVPRSDSHSLFFLCGQAAPELMSRLCAVNLCCSKFPVGTVAQTSIARINGIVVRHDIETTPGLLLLASTPAAEYFWTCLNDALPEFNGMTAGLTALDRLAAPMGSGD